MSFIAQTILDRFSAGSISIWGRAGEVDPPHLVMPSPWSLTNDLFLNLWMVGKPFKLDLCQTLPVMLAQIAIDEKSGYDHIFRPYRKQQDLFWFSVG